MILLELVRGRTTFHTLLPEALSVQMCISKSVLMPLPDSGIGSNATWWCTSFSSIPVAINPAGAALFWRMHKLLAERWWGQAPQAAPGDPEAVSQVQAGGG